MIKRSFPLKTVFLAIMCLLTYGCGGGNRLILPQFDSGSRADEMRYDMDGDGKIDFAMRCDAHHDMRILAYDDDEDGHYERIYNLDNYEPQKVPHLIILLDSIPYQCVLDKYNAGHFRWFPPPQKVIAAFPTLTDVVFNCLVHAPPRSGTNNHHYDHRINGINNHFRWQIRGVKETWQYYLDYSTPIFTTWMGFARPRDIYPGQLESIKQAFDQSPHRVTLAYDASSAGMVCKYGQQGVDECLDQLETLCIRLLWERRGALKISISADHGHNLMRSKFLSIRQILSDAGFTVTDTIEKNTDLVIDAEGLVNYVGIHTRKPIKVADTLLKVPQIQLAMYMAGDCVIVRDARGAALIEKKNGRLRYRPIDVDVLNYQPVIDALTRSGKMDAYGFATVDDWFAASINHEYPDAPARVWDAFHGIVVCTPDVMFTLQDGYHNGISWFDSLIDMASIHGGLNQVNSATFLLSMTGRATHPLRTADVLQTIEPGYVASYDPDR